MSMAVKKLVTLFKTEITKLGGSQEDEKNKIIKQIFSKIQQKNSQNHTQIHSRLPEQTQEQRWHCRSDS